MINYYSPYGSSGYAKAAQEYVKALNQYVSVNHFELKFDHGYVPYPKAYPVNIIHSTPEWWINYRVPGKLNIGYTVWETDKLDERWPFYMNAVDIVFVPCEWNKKVFEESGVVKPIYVIPHILPEIKEIDKVKDDRYIFYTIGQWTERKGIHLTIRAFCQAFTSIDNVVLKVKTFGNDYSKFEKGRIKRMTRQILAQFDNPPKVELLLDEWTDDQISELHANSDCYVSLCRSEGWGLGAFEALGYNNQVIMTGYGGQTEFLPKRSLINYNLIPVQGMEHIPWYNPSQKWAEPNLQEAVFAMRKRYKNRYCKLNFNKNKYSHNTIGNQIVKIIQ